MSGDFTYTTSSTQAYFTVSPTKQPQEVGSYVVRFTVCLTDYPTRCTSFDNSVTITNCVVTSVQVVDSGLSSLSDGNFNLNGLAFSKPLEAKLTPNCGYASSAWAATSTGITGTKPEHFLSTFSGAPGVYNLPGGTNPNRVGTYSIAITAVTVNGVAYTSLVSPSTFVLTVSTGCDTTTVTASTVLSITLKMGDTLAFYP